MEIPPSEVDSPKSMVGNVVVFIKFDMNVCSKVGVGMRREEVKEVWGRGDEKEYNERSTWSGVVWIRLVVGRSSFCSDGCTSGSNSGRPVETEGVD